MDFVMCRIFQNEKNQNITWRRRLYLQSELLSTTYSLVALKSRKQKLIVGRNNISRERALHSVDVKIYAQVCVYMALAIILHQQSFCNNM